MAENNDFYIYDHMQVYNERLLVNYPKILINISTFINRQMETLGSRNPGLRIMYTPKTENEFFADCGIEKQEVFKILEDSPNVDMKIVLAASPLYMMLMYMMQLYKKNSDYFKKIFKKEYVEPYKVINLYLTIKIYSWAQRLIFPHVPNAKTMEYVVDHLNDRYELARAPNIYSILQRYADTNYEWAQQPHNGKPGENGEISIRDNGFNMEHMRDKEMHLYVSNLDSRCKSFCKKLFVKWKEAYDNNQMTDVQKLEGINAEDGKSYYIVSENISSDVDLYTKKVLTTFIQETAVREKLLEIACKRYGSSKSKLRSIITSIKLSKDTELLYALISNMISYWIITEKQTPNTIHSKSFIIICSKAYSISNTQNTYILNIKDALTKLVDKYGMEYINSKRKTTVVEFKQAIYTYMVLYIASIT